MFRKRNEFTRPIDGADCVTYIVVNESTLCYRQEGTTFVGGVLAGSVLRGGHDWKDGPILLASSDHIRAATEEDFGAFRVATRGHLPEDGQ